MQGEAGSYTAFQGKGRGIGKRQRVFAFNDGEYDVPSVIRLMSYIKRPRVHRKVTKFEIFNRDKFTCQYCGLHTRELTIDHVIPKRRGGKHTWGNVVSACVACNRKKAGRTPKEASMPLLNEPFIPSDSGFHIPYYFLKSVREWQKYLPN